MKNESRLMKPSLRQRIREVLPLRVRRVLRVLYRILSAYYIRKLISQTHTVPAELQAHSNQIRELTDMASLVMRRMHQLEESILASSRRISAETLAAAEPSGFDESTAQSLASGPADWKQELKVALICRSWGRRCGVAEYSAFLADRLGATIVASTADLPLDTDVALIQYEPGYYSGVDDLIRELRLIRPSVIPVIDAHYILPEAAAELLWHAIVGVKRGFYPGTVRLSHIQQLPVIDQDEEPKELRLGSFGFAFPAKRYELVIALAKRLGIGATILASHNNATDGQGALSSAYLAELKRLATDKIEVIDEFLPVEEVVQRLSRCSHLISCMEDNGAQSGSLRIMAAAGRPLISLRSTQAEDVSALLVDSLDEITLDFLKRSRKAPEPYDGIHDYNSLLDRIARFRKYALARTAEDEEKIGWLRKSATGRTVVVGIGNGLAANSIRAATVVDADPGRLAVAAARYPHLDLRAVDPRIQVLPGFETIIFDETAQRMPESEARHMIAIWAETGAKRILVTAIRDVGAVKAASGMDLAWEPAQERLLGLVPANYTGNVSVATGSRFAFLEMTRERNPHAARA